MTATDRAFIRAYGLPSDAPADETPDEVSASSGQPAAAAQNASSEPDQVSHRAQSDEGSPTRVESAPPARAVSAPRSFTGQTTVGTRRVTTYVPPPHIPLGIPGRQTAARRGQAACSSADTSSGEGDKGEPEILRPLSQFMAQRQARGVFEPAFEVPGVSWPAACERLAEEMAPTLDHLLDRLIEGALESMAPLLTLCSLRRGEGRTTTTLCLARRASQLGLRVALVDGDLGQPKLARCLGVEASAGWETVLEAAGPLAEVAILSPNEQLTLVPAVQPVEANQLKHAVPSRVPLAMLRESHDLVLLDTGPLIDEDQVTEEIFAGLADCSALLLCDCRTADASSIRHGHEQLTRLGAHVLGLVENFVTTVAPGAEEVRRQSA